MFVVESGVRQGSKLSPAIFDVFMNAFIVNLRLLDAGCHNNYQYVGFFLYGWYHFDFTFNYWSATNVSCMFARV